MTALRTLFLCLSALCFVPTASALSLADISGGDATGGLREALTQGAGAAVSKLGQADGFLGNSQVKIPLPDGLRQAEGLLRGFGMGKQADELVTAMNRAAESAVARAKPILVNAVKRMSVDDAKQILSGGDDSVTQYFRRATSGELTEQFLPIVRKATERVKLAEKYNKIASKGARFGLIKEEDAKLENYVTEKALDGLFFMIAEEERAIRKDPVGAAGKLAKKVFGALGQ